MPVVRSCNADCVDLRIGENAAEVGFRTAFIRLVCIVNLLSGSIRTNLVAVASANDLESLVELRIEELRSERCALLNTATDERESALFTRLKRPQGHLVGCATGKRGSSRASDEK
jgi:hypothetical protein